MKKIFKVTNQQPGAWSDSTHTLLGWEIDEHELIISKLKGCDITFDGFLTLCKRELNELEKACKDYKRVNPYKLVEEKINNRYKPILRYLVPRGSFWEKREQVILYVTCYWKLPDQVIFIPDLLLLLNEWKDIMDNEIEYIEVKEIKNIIQDPEEYGYILP